MKITRKTQLNEGYGIAIKAGGEPCILFVIGKRVSEHCAIIYNHEQNSYSFTVIGTGCSVGIDRFKTINKAMESKQYLLLKNNVGKMQT